MAEVQTWKCTTCDADFKSGHWKGCGGDAEVEHRVAPKTYYNLSDGGLPTALKVNNISPLRQTVNAKGMTVTIPGKKAQFLNGTFTTDDPEIQFNMEKRGFTMTAEQFREAQESDKEKAGHAKAELQEERTLRHKAERELAELKAAKSKAKAAA